MKKNFAVLVIALLLASFTAGKIFANFLSQKLELNLDEPKKGTYRSDEYVFLKTFYLMKNGGAYYPSYQTAFSQNTMGTVLSPDAFTWRQPTIFYLWKFTAGDGQGIFSLFLSVVILSLVSIFFITKKFAGTKAGILAPILVLPYFADTILYKTAFLFVEWWAWFFLIFGLAFFVYGKKVPAFFLLILSLFTRELIIIPISAFFIYGLFTKSYRVYFLVMIAAFSAYMIFHTYNVYYLFNAGSIPLGGMFNRLHGFERNSFLPMISFSMRQYPLVSFKIHYFLILLSAVVFVKNLLVLRKSNLTHVHLAGISFLLTLPFITTSIYNDYWGIIFVPTLIMSLALAFSKSDLRAQIPVTARAKKKSKKRTYFK